MLSSWLLVAVVLTGLGVAGMLDWVFPFLDRVPKGTAQLFLVGGIAIPLLVSSAIIRHLNRWSYGLLDRLSLPCELPFPVLIVRATSDEASSALGGPQLLSSLATRLLRLLVTVIPLSGEKLSKRFWLTRVVLASAKWLALPGCAVFLLLAALAVTGLLYERVFTSMLYVGGVLLISGTAIFVATVLGVFILYPIVWLLLLLTSVAMVPFGGWGLAFATLSLQVSAEATPPGKWEVVQLSALEVQFQAEGPLQHGTHTNQVAINRLSSWLREVVLGWHSAPAKGEDRKRPPNAGHQADG